MNDLIFVLFAGLFGLCLGSLPVPKGISEGFPYKAKSASEPKVQIELFLDLTCPDSKAAFPVAKEVADHYGSQVRLRSFMFPLPYHRASFLACRGTFAINSFNPDLTYQWMQSVFDEQANLYNGATANMGDDTIEKILARWSSSLGMKKPEDYIEKSTRHNGDAIMQWKYGCSRRVYGTPTAFVNGINVNMKTSWTLADWGKIIDPLL